MPASLLGMLAYSWIRKRLTVPKMVKLIGGGVHVRPTAYGDCSLPYLNCSPTFRKLVPLQLTPKLSRSVAGIVITGRSGLTHFVTSIKFSGVFPQNLMAIWSLLFREQLPVWTIAN